MSDVFIGEIRGFANRFCPVGWLPCDGSLQPIINYQPLFAVIGTTYGGDGRTTFGLPNLQGMAMLGVGTGIGLSPYKLGQQVGAPSIGLNATQMPTHNHTVTGIIAKAADTYSTPSATSQLSRTFASGNNATNTYSDQATDVQMAPQTLAVTGSNAAHENRQPLLPFIYGIAWDGIFPPPA